MGGGACRHDAAPWCIDRPASAPCVYVQAHAHFCARRLGCRGCVHHPLARHGAALVPDAAVDAGTRPLQLMPGPFCRPARLHDCSAAHCKPSAFCHDFRRRAGLVGHSACRCCSALPSTCLQTNNPSDVNLAAAVSRPGHATCIVYGKCVQGG